VTQAKRVLVTGAGGFIGRWSVAPLLGKGYDVHAVLSPSGRTTVAELQGAQAHSADLLNEAAVDALLRRVAPTHLLHFAWIATPGLYWHSADNDRWRSAGEFLLRRFWELGGIRAVMSGSCAEYDWTRAGVCAEYATPLADEAHSTLMPYAASKIAMQKSLAEFGRRNSLSTAWGRIFFQFGPYEHEDRLVPSVIRHLLLNEEAPCTHGQQVRSFLHVADVGGAFAQLLDSHIEGPVNIGSAESISIADLITRIAAKIGRADLLRLGARAPAAQEPPLLVPAIHRLHDEVRFVPRYSLNAGIEDTIAWWRRQLAPRGKP
jgi:nucleoside-diphosphate-sugar epimerase